MRIESLVPYKYFFHLIKEEPISLNRYSYLIALIPLLAICIYFDWNKELLLFLSLGYFSAAIGFSVAYKSGNNSSVPFRKRVYQRFILESLKDIIIVQDKRSQKISYVNSAFYKLLGFESQSSPSIRFEDFVDAESIHLFKKQTSKKSGIQPFRKMDSIVRLKKQNGDFIWMDFQSENHFENDDFIMYSMRNVTDKVLLEKATRQFANDLVQRKNNLKTIKRKEAEVIMMMNIERSKYNVQ